jgi:hypothetical protein
VVGANIGLTDTHFQLMGAETAKTPFGSAYNFSGMAQPFKVVQHGQLGKLLSNAEIFCLRISNDA